MMKNYLIVLFALLVLPLAACAVEFEEGKHYEVVTKKATEQPEVIEFFSYYCGHCYHFEPMVKFLEQGIKGAELERAHVDFLYAIDRQLRKAYPVSGKIVTRGYAMAEMLGVVDAVSKQLYNRNLLQKRPVKSVSDLRAAFIEAGVSAKDFDDNYNSQEVSALVTRMAQKTKRYHVKGTPTVIVNGKYKVLAGGVNQDVKEQGKDFVTHYIKLVNYLIQKKD